MRNQERRAECGKLRAEFGELRAEFGEWRVESEGCGFSTYRSAEPAPSGVWKVKSGVWRVESGAEGTRLPPLQGEGDRRAVEGF